MEEKETYTKEQVEALNSSEVTREKKEERLKSVLPEQFFSWLLRQLKGDQ